MIFKEALKNVLKTHTILESCPFSSSILLTHSPLLVSDADADGLAELEVALGHGVGGGGAQREHHLEHLRGLVERALPIAVVTLSLAWL